MEKNLFGTDGIRRQVGKEPFTSHSLPQIGDALGYWAHQNFGTNAKILIGHDTRISCDFVKSALKSGILQYPVCTYDAGILPTPVAFQILKYTDHFDIGIVVSASHNPYFDNGIKLIKGKNGKISIENELYISQLFYDEQPHKQHKDFCGKDVSWDQGKRLYSSYITSCFKPNFLEGITVVLDCANGATYKLAPHLFKKFGANTVTISDQPNGKNINKNCGSTHIQNLQNTVLENKADIGFAFDGDGDRVIAVSKNGTIKDGDDILALLLSHPIYKANETIVGTIMTNKGFEKYIESIGKKLIRTPVGDKYVAEQLIKKDLSLGGEQSGHIIVRDHLNTGDGIFVALRVLESVISTNNKNLETFEKFPQTQINIPINFKKNLQDPPLSNIIEEEENKLSGGRLIVRYSGTENKLRIMVEEQNKELAELVGKQLAKKLSEQLI